MSGFAFFETPAGLCGLAWNDALEICGGQLPEPTAELTRCRMQQRFPQLREVEPPPAIAAVLQRLAAALQGTPDTLEDVPLADEDVPEFNRRVYALARHIPPGQTRTFG
jgi:methylated-DNA-[protein]-cysteine S-methyltransferase